LLSNSFFLFGARGVGKTSLIRESLESARVWTIDLLDNEQEDHYSRHPDQLYNQIAARCHEIDWVFIDEIQKVPSLLNVVHRALESSEFKSPKFALTGSSARKLKRGSANLLAGRAFTYNLFPLTHVELGQSFDLDDALNWGTLPKIYSCASAQEKSEFLRAYGLTYLKEEIWNEHLIDDLEPFRTFLEVVAQTNGTIVNYAKLARDVGIDEKTVKRYFEILEETLIGFHLSAFSRSIRKRQSRSPKFYLFDTGVTRA
jgi:predicted AAA+ superfamily ATPase